MVAMDIDELETMLYKWPTCGGMYMITMFLLFCNAELCMVQNIE